MVLFENDAVFLLKTGKEDALRNYFRVRHLTSHSKYSWIFMTDHVDYYCYWNGQDIQVDAIFLQHN